MMCYKDRSWCSAKDCQNMECNRNTNNKEVFNPDEFWSKRVSYMNFRKDCKDYIPTNKHEVSEWK